MHDDVIDEAIEVAVSRTKSAQDVVAEEIAEARIPDVGDVERVVHRAEDLESLTAELATHASDRGDGALARD